MRATALTSLTPHGEEAREGRLEPWASSLGRQSFAKLQQDAPLGVAIQRPFRFGKTFLQRLFLRV